MSDLNKTSGLTGTESGFRNRVRLLTAFSWMAAGLGALIGVYSLVVSGTTSLADPRWLGLALVGSTSVIGSVAAVHNRYRAGMGLLLSVPLVAFCGAYPESVLWVETHARSFQVPLAPPLVLALEVLFFLPVVAAILVIWRGRRAIALLVLSIVAAGVAIAVSESTRIVFWELAGWSALLTFLGGFWLWTHQLGWPALPPVRQRTLSRRLAMAVLMIVCGALVTLSSILVISAQRSTIEVMGDGSGPHLYARPWRPGYAVFTAKLLRVGHTARVSGQWAGKWAVGRVQEDFGGRPWLPFHFVLLRGRVFLEGESYLIDGFRTDEALTNFLPIVEAGSGARTLSLPISDPQAKTELWLLQHPPRKGSLSIVGLVSNAPWPEDHVKPPPSTGSPDRIDSEGVYQRVSDYRRRPPSPAHGLRIRATAASGATTVATTNVDGFYLLRDLQPDQYILEFLDLPERQCANQITVTKEELVREELSELRTRLFWCNMK